MAPPGVVIVNVTELVLAVTVLPPRSWIVTTGWVANATPPVGRAGLGREAELGGGADGDGELALVAAVRPPSAA